MQFQQVIGQSSTKQHLVEMLAQNRLSHALLFLAKEGSGGLPLALAFAQYITCEKRNSTPADTAAGLSLFSEAPVIENPQPLTDACGVCASCIKNQQMVHPDVHFSYPVIPRKAGEKPISTFFISEWRTFVQQKPYGNVFDWLQFIEAENKQGNITAEECNEINKKLNLKSFESGFKILILWMPEYLGKEGNKLLKLIEEPPPNTLFLLVAVSESQILPTILSRTQLIKIPVLTNEAIENALIHFHQIAPEIARQTARIAEGNYREALQHLQHAGEDWLALLREWLNAVLKTGSAALLKWIETINKLGREKQKQLLLYFTHQLEQSIRLRTLGEHSGWAQGLPENELEFAARLNSITDINQQHALVQELDRTAYHIERNANAKILFHALSIRMNYIIRNHQQVYAW